MGKKLTRKQLDLLGHLATYQLFSAEQVAVLQELCLQASRKRLRELVALGLLEGRPHGYGRGRGRPARIHSPTNKGAAHLRSSGQDGTERIRDLHFPEKPVAVDHQILLIWRLLHLPHLEKVLPQLRVHLVAQPRPLGESLQRVASPRSGRGEPRSLSATIPDAVFSITCAEQSKTILFFLEVDMATETMASLARTNRDFRSKLLRYQEHFRSGRYKAYHALCHCQLRGFRLLVVANSRSRLASLCRLVREMPPSDFVWLTDQASLFAEGISAAIWARGGHLDSPPQSIVGLTFCRAAPLQIEEYIDAEFGEGEDNTAERKLMNVTKGQRHSYDDGQQ